MAKGVAQTLNTVSLLILCGTHVQQICTSTRAQTDAASCEHAQLMHGYDLDAVLCNRACV